MSRERPILFSGPMVRAILDGRKTQTRRVVKGRALEWLAPGMFAPSFVASPKNDMCHYGAVGDRLWVRETWCEGYPDTADPILYRASYHGGAAHKWRPSIFMRREYSRLNLEITDVRVERLQDIRCTDIRAEGFACPEHDFPSGFCTSECAALRSGFAQGWDSLNAKRGYGWEVNPWVWCVTFKPEAPRE